MQSTHMLYLAPLQGFTDFAYRKSYHRIFGGIDAYLIPYLSVGSGDKIRNSQYREILPEHNQGIPVIPQVLCAHVSELIPLANMIRDFGYDHLNLNMGCPYPMATHRGRGTALIENQEALKEILDTLFARYQFNVSVKFRAGLTDNHSIFNCIDLLKSYPLDQLIFHPRTADQLYKGEANRQLYADFAHQLKHPLVYNGDLRSASDLEEVRNLVPGQNNWMIGRALLSNPFLVHELNGTLPSKEEQYRMKSEFHHLMLELYQQTFSDQGQVLMKMKSFWSYFSQSFSNPHKAFKPIKKASSLIKFKAAFPLVFQEYSE